MEESERRQHHQNSQSNQPLGPSLPAVGHHPQLPLFPVAEREIDGVQMGVLNDGTPYLTTRGLARMCGVEHTSILRLANNWGDERFKPRGRKLYDLLVAQGHASDALYFRTGSSGGDANGFPDTACMAFLEYYAFEAGQWTTETAKTSFRILARKSLKHFIYEKCGYNPSSGLNGGWKNFHDRLSMVYNSVPAGYFGVFHAIADIFVSLGEQGLHTDSSFIPDGSIGKLWSTHWQAIEGDLKFGPRIHYPHSYPNHFPQAAANPQEAWAYPEMALGEFHRWRREVYIAKGAFLRYLAKKEKDRGLPVGFAQKATLALQAQTTGPALNR